MRELNEDSVAVLEAHGLVVLADGMGGYNAGDVASQLAVEAITTGLLPHYTNGNESPVEQVLAETIAEANEAILSAMVENPEYQGMATTLVAALFCERRVYYAHVGDSRLYRWRQGILKQMTKDHSMVQALVDEGMFSSIQEALDAGVKNNVLFRGLGIEAGVEADLGVAEVSDQDLYLLCSDGLSNMVPDQDIAGILEQSAGDLEGAAEQLLSQALNNGGLDNVSLVLVSPQS